jgi:hypothetical protein
VKRCRKKTSPRKVEPTPDLMRRYMQALAEEHQEAWHAELMSAAPHWTYLLGLHLRLIELENLETGAEELL